MPRYVSYMPSYVWSMPRYVWPMPRYVGFMPRDVGCMHRDVRSMQRKVSCAPYYSGTSIIEVYVMRPFDSTSVSWDQQPKLNINNINDFYVGSLKHCLSYFEDVGTD